MGGKSHKLGEQIFGNLEVLYRLEQPGIAIWVCRCTCGTVKEVSARALVTGWSRSCGCGMKKTQFSFESLETRLLRNIDKNGPLILRSRCWLWLGGHIGTNGDRPVIRPPGGVQRRVSHIMLEREGSERPSQIHQAAHKCDNPYCIRPSHLWWATPKENMQDASRKGRMNSPHGEHLEKIKNSVRQRWKDPEFRQKHAEATKRCMETPEWKIAQSNGVRDYHKLPRKYPFTTRAG